MPLVPAPAGEANSRGRTLWSMQPNIERWLRNTIVLPVCAGRPNPVNSTCDWKKNSRLLQTVRKFCAGGALRSMRAIQRSSNSDACLTNGAGQWRAGSRCQSRPQSRPLTLGAILLAHPLDPPAQPARHSGPNTPRPRASAADAIDRITRGPAPGSAKLGCGRNG
jgi:hypothetical protein